MKPLMRLSSVDAPCDSLVVALTKPSNHFSTVSTWSPKCRVAARNDGESKAASLRPTGLKAR